MEIGTEKPAIVIEPARPPVPMPVRPAAPVRVPVPVRVPERALLQG